MNYTEKTTQLLAANFTRVERDDRLLDIFPLETREKGIELWEKWNEDTVEIIRFHLPYSPKREQAFSFSKEKIETMLLENKKGSLVLE